MLLILGPVTATLNGGFEGSAGGWDNPIRELDLRVQDEHVRGQELLEVGDSLPGTTVEREAHRTFVRVFAVPSTAVTAGVVTADVGFRVVHLQSTPS